MLNRLIERVLQLLHSNITLPHNVHVLTMQSVDEHQDGSADVLLRLEHYFDYSESAQHSRTVSVDLKVKEAICSEIELLIRSPFPCGTSTALER